MEQIKKIKVYYDGLCVLCGREIQHYIKQEGSCNIDFIDITKSDFNPQLEGLDPYLVNKFMHVQDQAGQLYTPLSLNFR
jgi:predicted DCC family thiol-disulfide oxidoreductase YuxK